ncbi:MAG: DUF2076 family protein [Acidobacteriaceae bacterium]|nr:DUF2076 family protein [Acidobacteriaceae bacterium]
MTPDERNLLNDLANKIAQTPPPPKDPEAEEFIRTHIGNRPDALYLMTQTVLIQNLALQNAQQQIQQLQQRAGQPVPAGAGSFLGGQGQRGGQQQYAAPPPAQYAPPVPSAPAPSGAPSFLRGAAQTAAGVAAGALAFEAVQSLFSHPGYGGGGFFGGGGGLMGGAPVEETVVNNYYDNPGDGGRDDYRAEEADTYQDTGGDGGQVDDGGQYDDASYDPGDDGGSFDDNSGGNDFA